MHSSLLHHNTFAIAATCNELLEYDNVELLRKILMDVRRKKWLHIGGGSNLLFLNEHYDGTILHSRIKGIEIAATYPDSVVLRVGAGEDWDHFVGYCVEHGFYGLENLSCIPGEVGASAIQNVGAYGVEAGDLIERVETIEVESGEARVFTKAECEYGYRSSVFKHKLRNRYIVTHVVYRLSLHFLPVLSHVAVIVLLKEKGLSAVTATAADIRRVVTEVRRSKLPDPKEIGSAGSFFMNPVVSGQQAQRLLQQFPDMPHYPAPNGVKIPAAWLIEKCGWKGRQMGEAGVHPRQALVLVNLGKASGRDIALLAERIQADVYDTFGIRIMPEVLYVE